MGFDEEEEEEECVWMCLDTPYGGAERDSQSTNDRTRMNRGREVERCASYAS
jgi:hypothetical protein